MPTTTSDKIIPVPSTYSSQSRKLSKKFRSKSFLAADHHPELASLRQHDAELQKCLKRNPEYEEKLIQDGVYRKLLKDYQSSQKELNGKDTGFIRSQLEKLSKQTGNRYSHQPSPMAVFSSPSRL